MIEDFEDVFVYHFFDDFEVDYHAVFFDSVFNSDEDFVVVAVQMLAFAVIFGEKM